MSKTSASQIQWWPKVTGCSIPLASTKPGLGVLTYHHPHLHSRLMVKGMLQIMMATRLQTAQLVEQLRLGMPSSIAPARKSPRRVSILLRVLTRYQLLPTIPVRSLRDPNSRLQGADLLLELDELRHLPLGSARLIRSGVAIYKVKRAHLGHCLFALAFSPAPNSHNQHGHSPCERLGVAIADASLSTRPLPGSLCATCVSRPPSMPSEVIL